MSHPILTRQLHLLGLDAGRIPTDVATWALFLRQVGATYVEAEQSCQATERDRLRMVISALGAGLLMMDEGGIVVSVNGEAERLLGCSEAAMIGQDGRALFFGADAAARHRPWNLTEGQVHREDRATARTADGRALSVSYAVSPVFVAGAFHGVGLAFQDITSRDEKERELLQQRQELALARDIAEAASRAKSDFLASMSHEIRTPLNGILGLATLVLTESLTPEQRLRLETIRNSGDSLLAIINDVMDAARVESGRLTLVCEPVDLVEVVESTIDLFHATAVEKGLGLAFGASAGAPRFVVGDAGRVRQILSNLIGNAVKFTESGRVSVRVESGNGEVRVLVSDTGIGIRPEARQRMFQVFSQEDATTTRRFGGSGLGLAISKELALLMNGRIDFESTVGQGSTFTLTLKVEPVPPGVQPAVWPRILPAGSQIAVCGLAGTLARQLEAFAAANCAELVLPPFTEKRLPKLVAIAGAAEAPAEIREMLEGPWSSVPRLVFGVGPRERTVHASGFASLTVPVAVSPSRLVGSVRHLLGMPAIPARTKAYENAFDRKTSGVLSVLLVEDNPVNVLVAAGFLKRMGCVTEIVGNGRIAIERACNAHFDLVLMDVHMPEVDGLEATRRIREQVGEKVVRIIGVSAATSPDEIQLCLDAGMDGFLSKPLQPQALRNALDDIAGEIAAQGKTAA